VVNNTKTGQSDRWYYSQNQLQLNHKTLYNWARRN
ncbi:MAG: hypothetical protein ACI97P_002409, partial [Arcticibacterium sp.]